MIIMTITVTAIAIAIALQGCAICDNSPPNYAAAAVIGAAAVALFWFFIRVLARLFADHSYSDRENPR